MLSDTPTCYIHFCDINHVSKTNEFGTDTFRSTNPSCLTVVCSNRYCSRGLRRSVCSPFTLDYRATWCRSRRLIVYPPHCCRFHHRICSTEARLAWSMAASDRRPRLGPLSTIWALVGARRGHLRSGTWRFGVALGRAPRLLTWRSTSFPSVAGLVQAALARAG